jgi:hypothetical protein
MPTGSIQLFIPVLTLATLIPCLLSADADALSDESILDTSPQYCCDEQANCQLTENSEACTSADPETESDREYQDQNSSLTPFARTVRDSELPSFESGFSGSWGDLMRWLHLNPEVPIIARGRVVDSEGVTGTLPNSDRSVILTNCTLEVEHYFKGDNGSEVTYQIIGGTVPGIGSLSLSDGPTCNIGETLLVFLMKRNNRLMPAKGRRGSILLADEAGNENRLGSVALRFYTEEVK